MSASQVSTDLGIPDADEMKVSLLNAFERKLVQLSFHTLKSELNSFITFNGINKD